MYLILVRWLGMIEEVLEGEGLAVVEVLLRAGFNVNMRTKSGTALHEAALCGKAEVVRTLLEHGVNTNIRDSNNYTVMDLLSQFNNAQAAQEIISLLKRHKRGLPLVDSDGESISQPFPTLPNTDSDLGSPYENVRPSSKNARSVVTDPSPSTSPQRWDYHQKYARPPEGFDDRRVSGVSEHSIDSDNSLYHLPSAPRQFMDTSTHSEDLNYLCSSNRESDQISISSTASSLGYGRRPDSGGVPLYIPMNRGSHSPGSGSKVSPTPPKKPPRRSVPLSPTHSQPMSASVDGVSNGAYEYLFLAHSGTRSQNNLNEYEKGHRRERLGHGHSMDQYVEMNVFNIALDDDPIERPKSELQRGKSEDLDNRKKPEPVAISSLYENIVIKQQNPRRKLRRHNDVYEEYTLKKRGSDEVSCSSAPERTFISSAYITISENGDKSKQSSGYKCNKTDRNYPLSPTHYNQPPTPEHPPPSAMQAESIIYEKIRPLSQSDEVFLNFSSVFNSRSYAFAFSDGLIKSAASGVLESLNMNIPAVRPKTLKKLKRVYDNSTSDDLKSDNEISSSSEKESDNKENRDNKGDRMSALSPFDEQEEWAKIQEIMASFGTGIVRESVFVVELEKEFQNRLMTISCSQNSLTNAAEMTVENWLDGIGLVDYADRFISNGFDDVGFLNGVLEENNLVDMGIASKEDRLSLLEAVKQLPLKTHIQTPGGSNSEQSTVKLWLKRIRLDQYFDTFNKHLYHDMDRIKRIWDVELSAVLDIEKIGHRKRILASVSSGESIASGPKMEEISLEAALLKAVSQSSSEMPSPSSQSNHSSSSVNTGTIRHRHKKSRPAPQPPGQQKREKRNSEMFVGGSNSIKSQWRHQPMLLITGTYGGSTSIKESKGTESTKKSIQKVAKSKDHFLEEIVLSVSYKGVKFINPSNQSTICEHKIVNMNCACQDDEQQSYFAYITKDNDLHYCHVFQAPTPVSCKSLFHLLASLPVVSFGANIWQEHATEIVLTLGQAFELAYQMALRDHVTNKCKSKMDYSRVELHKPAVSPGSSRDFKDSTKTADMKLNGHPLKIMPLTLSIAAEPGTSSASLNQAGQNKTPTKVVSTDISALKRPPMGKHQASNKADNKT
ncbi:hypothetical protein YQE_03052, partial [Dendroctonus ponderosae]